MRTLALVSGGLDSAVLLHQLVKVEWHDVDALSFNYGQTHKRELECAAWLADHVGASYYHVDISRASSVFGDNLLTGGGKSPEVPNRNGVFLALASSLAVSLSVDAIAIAVHADDARHFPDCRSGFFHAFDFLNQAALGLNCPRLIAPFLARSKAEIIQLGQKLGVDFGKTWTCYGSDSIHCGTCLACQERKRAFVEAEVVDPVVYRQ